MVFYYACWLRWLNLIKLFASIFAGAYIIFADNEGFVEGL